jgi:transposase-like protein
MAQCVWVAKKRAQARRPNGQNPRAWALHFCFCLVKRQTTSHHFYFFKKKLDNMSSVYPDSSYHSGCRKIRANQFPRNHPF